MTEPIMSGPNDVFLVRKVGSFMTSLFFACYSNIIPIPLTSRKAVAARKESDKMDSLPGRRYRRSGRNLRTATDGSDKGELRDVIRNLA
jgi:hypothetical protein